MSDAADEVAALEAADGKAEEVQRTHRTNCDRRKVLKTCAYGQQRTLQTLSGQQN